MILRVEDYPTLPDNISSYCKQIQFMATGYKAHMKEDAKKILKILKDEFPHEFI